MSERRTEDGFEFEGTFYRWHVSDVGKDLMLIDRLSGLPVTDFYDVIDDKHERARGPIMLTLIATSIRAGHPDWSVERIARMVMNLSLSEVVFVEGEAEESLLPPPEEAATPPEDERSRSPSNDSSSSSTPAESTTSEPSFAAPI